MLHRSLKFYGDGIKHFEEAAEDEMQRYLEELTRSEQSDFDMNDIIKKSFANTMVRLMTDKPAEKDVSENVLQWVDTTNHFLSGLSFVYDFILIVRLQPGPFAYMNRETIASRDYILDRFYFTEKDADKPTDGEEYGLVKGLMKLQDEINKNYGSEIITDNDVKGIILEIFTATTDTCTTSAILINTFALLLTHSNVAKKIQNEIREVVGSERKPRFSDKEHTSRDIRKPKNGCAPS